MLEFKSIKLIYLPKKDCIFVGIAVNVIKKGIKRSYGYYDILHLYNYVYIWLLSDHMGYFL